MTNQTKAQRLADLLETNIWEGKCGHKERDEAAAELRRLDALNAELVERLQRLCDETEQGFFSAVTRDECRLLIAKAKEQT